MTNRNKNRINHESKWMYSTPGPLSITIINIKVIINSITVALSTKTTGLYTGQ